MGKRGGGENHAYLYENWGGRLSYMCLSIAQVRLSRCGPLTVVSEFPLAKKYNSDVRSRCGPGNAHFISIRQVSLLVR